MNEVAFALKEFTRRFCDQWQEETGGWPASEALYGIPSPCIVTTTGGERALAAPAVYARSGFKRRGAGIGYFSSACR
ncbi:SecY interacting protein Syd [Cedecea neteri]|uniref:SecY interacting protein Syd n=1 Tax=Cedecea neteri TaxID=158822 RepID=A0A2X2T3T1_9ENTR|nr:SecY interacting protein Syd [Cedecea neteri]